MRETGGAQNLRRHIDRPVRVERAVLVDDRFERPALEILHRDVVRAAPLTAVVDRDDVLVLKPCCCRGLASKAFNKFGVLREAAVEQLDRHFTIELKVGGAVDVSHPA
ncbi:unannotated protein [freshwater metagenome]|uniref:Unannotated protein n=1 Tax=freshwater metagenome TaxID=449393 RepID=A0A6J7S661_9ZZZZ